MNTTECSANRFTKKYIAEFTDKKGNQLATEFFKADNLVEAKACASFYKRHQLKQQCSTSVRVVKSN